MISLSVVCDCFYEVRDAGLISWYLLLIMPFDYLLELIRSFDDHVVHSECDMCTVEKQLLLPEFACP